MGSKSVYAAAAIMLVCVIVFGVAVGTEHWQTVDLPFGGKAYSGLWQVCSSGGGSTSCTDIDLGDCSDGNKSDDAKESCNDLKATRAFAVLAVLFAAFAWVCQMLVAFDKTPRAFTPGLVLAVLTCVSGVIAFSIFADNKPSDSDVEFDYSFGLEVTGSVLALFSSVLFWYGGRTGAYFSF